jgi:hypothetical protein
MGSALGNVKMVAKQLMITPGEYQRKREIGWKWCYRCRQWKTDSSYHRNKARRDGLSVICRECWKEYRRKH